MPDNRTKKTKKTNRAGEGHSSSVSSPSYPGFICPIHQATYLLDRQLRKLEQEFLHAGGLRERMTRARLAARTSHQ
jgi:four helix bundle suffix protein